ncbi:MAG: hypothetical protein V4662_21940 [Verrucomicrobiota bacterium]
MKYKLITFISAFGSAISSWAATRLFAIRDAGALKKLACYEQVDSWVFASTAVFFIVLGMLLGQFFPTDSGKFGHVWIGVAMATCVLWLLAGLIMWRLFWTGVA